MTDNRPPVTVQIFRGGNEPVEVEFDNISDARAYAEDIEGSAGNERASVHVPEEYPDL